MIGENVKKLAPPAMMEKWASTARFSHATEASGEVELEPIFHRIAAELHFPSPTLVWSRAQRGEYVSGGPGAHPFDLTAIALSKRGVGSDSQLYPFYAIAQLRGDQETVAAIDRYFPLPSGEH